MTEETPDDNGLTDFVHSVVAEYQPIVNADAELLSLLYDIELLPEQLLHVLSVNPPAAGPNANRMAVVCLLWKARDPLKWDDIASSKESLTCQSH